MQLPEDRSLIRAPADGTSVKGVEWDTEGIQVLRILADGSQSKIEINTIDTKLLGPNKMAKTENALSENWVKHVPDLRMIQDSKFDWKNRLLVIANIDSHDWDHPEDAKGYWCMYKCNDPGAWSWLKGAGKNKYFQDVGDARAFGDVYVFRLEHIAPDRFGRRKYAKTWEVPEDDVARRIFVSLASCDGREEIAAEGEKSGERSKQMRFVLG